MVNTLDRPCVEEATSARIHLPPLTSQVDAFSCVRHRNESPVSNKVRTARRTAGRIVAGESGNDKALIDVGSANTRARSCKQQQKEVAANPGRQLGASSALTFDDSLCLHLYTFTYVAQA
ncbi:hypothetical protein HPB50_025959 [Hyalomma asiaticum]|uniref:Uncharacterized protein n=1 Tax=Hyalomma asiaticum TaxID=266040 RepID=A0ACB7T1N4_HYAAI|nr:hypothetical protein HPB50_025959 [Hyalomma asiaticum]